MKKQLNNTVIKNLNPELNPKRGDTDPKAEIRAKIQEQYEIMQKLINEI